MAKVDIKKYARNCSCCKKITYYCPRGCAEFKHIEPWHDAYCSLNCKDLYNICAGFVNGWLTPEQEAERLKDMDLSYEKDLSDWMQDAIKEMKKLWTTDKEDAKIDNKVVKVVNEENIKVDDSTTDTKTEVDTKVESKVENKVENVNENKEYNKHTNKYYRAKNNK